MQSNRSKIAITAVLIIASIAAYVFISNNIQTVRAAIKEKEATLAQLEGREQHLLALKANIAQTEGDRAKLASHFINVNTIADFLGSIETMGRNINLETTTVSLGIDNGALGIGITLRGSFQNIYHFLLLVEQLPYHIEIRQTALNYTAGSNPGPWSADIVLRVISYEQ
jgi:hypothetical protein